MLILHFLLSIAAASVSYSLAGPAPVLSLTDGPVPVLNQLAEAPLGSSRLGALGYSSLGEKK